jgi:hypothetical protein
MAALASGGGLSHLHTIVRWQHFRWGRAQPTPGPVSISRLGAKEGLRQMGGSDAGIAHGTSLA